MDNKELNNNADRIEAVFRQNQVPAGITGGNVTPRYIQFMVTPGTNTQVCRIESLERQIAAALGVPRAEVIRHGNTLRIDVPRHDSQRVHLLSLLARIRSNQIPNLTATLGLASDGYPLLIRLPAREVGHVLISGTTGTGKTSLLSTIVMSLAISNPRRAVQFVLIDPKHALDHLAGLPHLLHPAISDHERITSSLSSLNVIMHTRLAQGNTEPRLVIVIDELADLLQSGLHEIHNSLIDMLQHGQAAGLHVIAATEKPSSALLQPIISANFPVRITGRVVSREDAYAASGIENSGAEKLAGTGDLIAVYGNEAPRFDAAHLTAGETSDTIEKLKRGLRYEDICVRSTPNPRQTGSIIAQPDGSAVLLDWNKAIGEIPGL
jgi:DNA segregation ATPase FtsK/SpoIIIE, S-DNA-T family